MLQRLNDAKLPWADYLEVQSICNVRYCNKAFYNKLEVAFIKSVIWTKTKIQSLAENSCFTKL
jgi:hypothetical protein